MGSSKQLSDNTLAGHKIIVRIASEHHRQGQDQDQTMVAVSILTIPLGPPHGELHQLVEAKNNHFLPGRILIAR